MTTIKKKIKMTLTTASVLYKMMEFCFFLSSFIFPFFFPPDFLLNSPFDPFQILFVSKEIISAFLPCGVTVSQVPEYSIILCLGPGAHLAPRNGSFPCYNRLFGIRGEKAPISSFRLITTIPYLWLGGGYPGVSV